MQNRRNVTLGSLHDQPKTHTGKDRCFLHVVLVLLGRFHTGVMGTVTTSAEIRNHEKRVAEIVVRELKRAKPDVWGCVQSREVWSTEEEAHLCPGQVWICKFGTVPGIMSCVEKKFELQTRKWEEYKAEVKENIHMVPRRKMSYMCRS